MIDFEVIDEIFGCVVVMRRQVHTDNRGSFEKLFCSSIFGSAWGGAKTSVSQINLSRTLKAGTVRGMHFQTGPYQEAKIVNCISGKAFDVVVDLRPDSSTYLMHSGVTLDSAHSSLIYIPKGFAHGFQALDENTQLVYAHSQRYSKTDENGLHPLDDDLSIKWPLPVSLISKRDSAFTLLKDRDDV